MASSTMWLLLACSGRTLDVGTAKGAQNGSEADDPVDASTADESTASGSSRMTVDDVACVVTGEGQGGGRTWPTWMLTVDATCGALGLVRVLVESNADIAYPQSCSVATTVYASLEAEGDAGIMAYEASASRGSCTIASGPASTAPSTALSFTTTVVHWQDAARSHRLSYRGRSAP